MSIGDFAMPGLQHVVQTKAAVIANEDLVRRAKSLESLDSTGTDLKVLERLWCNTSQVTPLPVASAWICRQPWFRQKKLAHTLLHAFVTDGGLKRPFLRTDDEADKQYLVGLGGKKTPRQAGDLLGAL